MSKKFFAVLILVFFVVASPLAFAGQEVRATASEIKSGPVPPGQFAIMAKYADEFLSGSEPNRSIWASVLNDDINSTDTRDDLSDFYVLDVRQASDFVGGHIKGAVNVPYELVAKNLIMLPTDKPILVVCYTGHQASVITGILNTLGYDAWTLKFGMMSWTASSSQKIYTPVKNGQLPADAPFNKYFKQDIKGIGGELVVGVN